MQRRSHNNPRADDLVVTRSLQNRAPFETWGQLSLDGGNRWTPPQSLPGFREISGKVALSSDGAGRLYLAGISENGGSGSELVYSSWAGQDWSQRETFGIGLLATAGNQATTAILPAEGRLVVLARAAILTDTNRTQFELISTDRKIAEAPIVIQPTFTPETAVTPTAAPEGQPLPTAVPGQAAPLSTVIPTAPQPEPAVPSRFILFGIASAIGLGALAILFGFWRSRQR